MITEQNQIGSPFVIISKAPIEDPYNIEETNFILLKTEDGTLLSFREAYADGTGGKDTGVTIELFDPDHLFLLQFIDTNSVRAFEGFAKSKAGADAFGEAYDAIDDLVRRKESLISQNERSLDIIEHIVMKQDHIIATPGRKTSRVSKGRIRDDREISAHEASIAKNNKRLEVLSSREEDIRNGHFGTNNYFYITYGFGKDKNDHAPSRLFTFAKLEFLSDSAKQGSMRLGFTHNDRLSQDEMLEKEKFRHKDKQEQGEKKYFTGPLIHRIRFSDNIPGKVLLDETSDISNIMEVMLQNYLRETSPSEMIPLVFLSPEVNPKIEALMNGAKDENPIKGLALERVRGKETLTRLTKVKVLHNLLKNFGFIITHNYSDLAEVQYIPGRYENFDIFDGPPTRSESTAHYSIVIQKDKDRSTIDHVMEIIQNIYSELGITIGSDIVNANMIESEHVNYFLNDFLDGGGHPESILKTQEGQEYANIPETFNWTGVHCIGDGLFIGGVLFKLPYDENENILKEFGTAWPRSNIQRFIQNPYGGYLKLIKRIYVDPVRKAGRFDLPDEYATKLPSLISNKLRQQVPSFLANVQHSNVVSFIATHASHEQSELLTNLSNLFTHTYFKTIKDGNTRIKVKSKKNLTQEQIDGLLFDMLNYEYENSTDVGSIVSNVKKGWNSKDSDTSKAYKKILEAFLVNVKRTSLAKNHSISAHAVRAYMLYMQRIALRYSKIQAKTIPMFSIMPEFWITKPSLFLNKKLHSPNSTFFMNRESPFSGMYSIFGIEHVITSSECFSSFQLHKVEIPTGEIEKSPSKN